MKKTKILFSVLVAAFGVFLFIYGGYDDSPGAQLLGLLVVAGAVVVLIKNNKKNIRN